MLSQAYWKAKLDISAPRATEIIEEFLRKLEIKFKVKQFFSREGLKLVFYRLSPSVPYRLREFSRITVYASSLNECCVEVPYTLTGLTSELSKYRKSLVSESLLDVYYEFFIEYYDLVDKIKNFSLRLLASSSLALTVALIIFFTAPYTNKVALGLLIVALLPLFPMLKPGFSPLPPATVYYFYSYFKKLARELDELETRIDSRFRIVTPVRLSRRTTICTVVGTILWVATFTLATLRIAWTFFK
ncbi:MAG TPA: hypothetical protein ENF55_05770 [Thermoprotei archaeon]|nr:MAG: hypothetical protein DRJ63_08195 [Thermoprotei archaeon]HDI75447.1 hypothetical protein [Thermoprotei archaeon]